MSCNSEYLADNLNEISGFKTNGTSQGPRANGSQKASYEHLKMEILELKRLIL